MRIILTTRFYKNGQTTHVTDLCSELMRQGHEVLLIMTQLHDPDYARWLQGTKIPYVTTADPGKLRKCITRSLPKPQIIHNHSIHTLPLAETLGELLQVPKVTTVHYLDFDVDLLGKQDAVVLISQEMQRSFAHLNIVSHVAENGVSVPKHPSTEKPWQKRALFLAQVTPAKEENFVGMTRSLLSWGWTVSSAGNWHHRGVTSHGWVNDVGTLLKESDMMIGSGRAIRQGMAWGIPAWVLGAYCDGFVTPGNVTQLEETNFSGRFSRQPFSQSKAAIYLKNPSPGDMRSLGNFGRKRAEEYYSIDLMAEKLAVIYEECLFECSREK